MDKSFELKTLQASVTKTADFTGATVQLKPWRRAIILLNVTDLKAAAGDTFDVYVDGYIGTKKVNLAHFTQLLGNGTDAQSEVAVLDSDNPGTDVIATTSDCAAAKVRPAVFCTAMEVRVVVVDGGAHGQSITYSVSALVQY